MQPAIVRFVRTYSFPPIPDVRCARGRSASPPQRPFPAVLPPPLVQLPSPTFARPIKCYFNETTCRIERTALFNTVGAVITVMTNKLLIVCTAGIRCFRAERDCFFFFFFHKECHESRATDSDRATGVYYAMFAQKFPERFRISLGLFARRARDRSSSATIGTSRKTARAGWAKGVAV